MLAKPPRRIALTAACLAAGVLGLGAAGAASGQDAQPAKRDEPTALSGITVVAPNDLSGLEVNGRRRCFLEKPAGLKTLEPRATSTYPEEGATVRPGRLYIRITYNQRMSPCGFLLADALLSPQPEFLDEPALLTRDYKSFYFAVTTEPGKRYALRFNTFLAHNFRSLYGAVAPAHTLSFRTSDDPPVATMTEAMAGDSLSADIAEHPDNVLVLWVPRENGEGPDCGSCDSTESALKLGPALRPAQGP